MTEQERQKAVLALLQEKGELHVQTTCRSFHIMAMTAYHGLMGLEQMGALTRTHRGAIAGEERTFDAQTSSAKCRKLYTEKKQQLAHIVRGSLKEYDHVFLASGSMMDMLVSALLYYLSSTVVTSAVNVAYELYQNSRLTVLTLGGKLRSNSLTLTGPITQINLKQFQLSKAFLSVNVTDEKRNLRTDSMVESSLLETLFSVMGEVYVLYDPSKLGSHDFTSISHKQSYTLITDQDMDKSLLETYR